MKNCFFKKIIIGLSILHIATFCFSFESGWIFGVRADFGGTQSLPSVSEETLKYLNPLATEMSGFLSGLLIGGEASVGYIFDTNDIFSLSKNHIFSGIDVQGYVGVGMGNMSQKTSAEQGGVPIDVFVVVDYTPVVSFGLKSHALFFNNRFSVGLGIGGKALLDYTPQYLLYSSEPSIIASEIGTVVVPDDLLLKVNPLAFSIRFEMGYAIPILPTTEFLIGFYNQFNLYRPGYLTLPPSLEKLAQDNASPPNSLDFSQEFPDYWLNSLDFGINIGISLKI